ncbi:iron export ABC transporter permease subunit FetB [Phormidium sp. CLA17]|uniref:ABC transporter permease n=1 Tax=Leptolyngbya sp. Cla-17 TaxID=2803751 RepID=UPI001490E3C3|nr:iron export ABC transporter permease subunit FetB [Leptolyngbya sp. Cla-17]MBM0741855.1 iron export ABC transporter permease subunit FetB [Leptolyngbya sp. Cla-17]
MDSLLQLALALGMMAIAIALSAWQKLGLEWNLALATGRSVLQLLVLGYVLAIAFEVNNPWLGLCIVAVMLFVTAIVTRNRISQKIPKLVPIVAASLLIGVALTLVYTSLLVIQPRSWLDPRYLIPLTGIILGNAMNGAAITGERLVNSLNANPLEIETHLSLGATPQQAIAPYRRDAIRAGLLPTLNTATIIGLSTVPTFMAAQLLGGVPPLTATAYQLVVLFMVILSTLITIMLVTYGIYRQHFTQHDQLNLW